MHKTSGVFMMSEEGAGGGEGEVVRCGEECTPSITRPAYYRLGVFNILKLSRNLEEEEGGCPQDNNFWCISTRFCYSDNDE